VGPCRSRPASAWAWGNRKAGNAWLKWAFSEAAVLGAQKDERIGGLLRRLASRLGKAKALSALAHKLGRAFYHMPHSQGGLRRPTLRETLRPRGGRRAEA